MYRGFLNIALPENNKDKETELVKEILSTKPDRYQLEKDCPPKNPTAQ